MRYAITPATPDELDPLAPLGGTLGHARGPWNRASYYFRIRTLSPRPDFGLCAFQQTAHACPHHTPGPATRLATRTHGWARAWLRRRLYAAIVRDYLDERAGDAAESDGT